MENITLIIFTLIATAGILGIIFIAIHNRLQKYIIRIKEAESEIDETLRKRYDLLVSMENVINSNTDLDQNNFKDFEKEKMSNFDADRKLSKIKETFKMIASDYPDKLDNESFRNLLTEIKITEEKSDAAKAYYNKYTTSLNMLIKKFPSNIVASICHIEERNYFDNKNMNDKDILDFKL